MSSTPGHTNTATQELSAIILAAGEGTRMKSRHAKVVHEILGRPMVGWAVDAARATGCTRIVVVVGSHADEVQAALAAEPDIEFARQTRRLGTGHALRTALEATGIASGQVLVLYGDAPLLRPATLRQLLEAATDRQDASADGNGTGGTGSSGTGTGKSTSAGSACGGALLVTEYTDPTGYGRVLVDGQGHALRVIEQKDASAEELLITTCNAGVYCFDGAALAAHIGELSQENAQHEYYLTDMPQILAGHGCPLRAVGIDDASELLGVNSRAQLAEATRVMQQRINAAHMAAGVSMLDPGQVWIGPGVEIGQDCTLLPGTMLMGKTRIGTDCVVGPYSRLTDTQVGDGCILDETVAVQAQVEAGVCCGPRAYLRPGTHLMAGAKVGTHVEIKNSTVGPRSKVPHLSYIGDAQLGTDVNIGAGTITCNYDGKNKNATTVGDGAFVGSDCMLVAPVNVGAGATVGAGSVITADVPVDSLALERSEQRTYTDWQPRWKRQQPE